MKEDGYPWRNKCTIYLSSIDNHAQRSNTGRYAIQNSLREESKSMRERMKYGNNVKSMQMRSQRVVRVLAEATEDRVRSNLCTNYKLNGQRSQFKKKNEEK